MAVLLQDFLCFFVRVEGVHQNEGHVAAVGTIQLLDEHSTSPSQRLVPFHDRSYLELLDRKIEKGEATANGDDTLRSLTTHCRTQTTVQFHDNQSIQ